VILGLGLDIAATAPWREALDEPSGAALEALFTPKELRAVHGGAVEPAERLAARFAAKEACIKALGGGVADLREIEVVSEPSGRPRLRLRGLARARAEALGVRDTWLSLSHEGETAAAVVVLEGA
jgi:holo-[acyl-carrier protein] synthase